MNKVLSLKSEENFSIDDVVIISDHFVGVIIGLEGEQFKVFDILEKETFLHDSSKLILADKQLVMNLLNPDYLVSIVDDYAKGDLFNFLEYLDQDLAEEVASDVTYKVFSNMDYIKKLAHYKT